ncbi:hypothetical protein [Priestia megaterium]|uniref:hypothetical protein n=1 Tax=Priestia megaterium TaxID=1404 RepID=UPI002E1E1800|nr:hypothetical protein [Priestia megaterium]
MYIAACTIKGIICVVGAGNYIQKLIGELDEYLREDEEEEFDYLTDNAIITDEKGIEVYCYPREMYGEFKKRGYKTIKFISWDFAFNVHFYELDGVTCQIGLYHDWESQRVQCKIEPVLMRSNSLTGRA